MPDNATRTAYFSHETCLRHDMKYGHPESPDRLRAIEAHLRAAGLFDRLDRRPAPVAGLELLARVHGSDHIEAIQESAPVAGLYDLDPDTRMCPDTLEAVMRAAGGAAAAVDLVLRDEADTAFVACRPPGHHATRRQAMGFCFFNNVAVAAAHALAAHGLERVAIVDFDVHHGNGTEDIFKADPRVLLCSTFQHPLYPGSGAGATPDHIVNVPLPRGTDGEAYREVFSTRILPRLDAFQPQLLLISAGFDGHREDGLADFRLVEADYAWITERLVEVARRHAGGRVVSVLEGGYNPDALGRSVAAHVGALMA